MPRLTPIRNSFNAGEISALALGRSDLAKYPNALEALQNFIPLLAGGIQKRPGTRFIVNANRQDGPSRLVPFDYNLIQSFALEFGNKTLRFLSNNGGLILSGGNPYVVVTPYDTAVDDLWDLKFAQVADIMYITHPNHPPMKLSRITDTNWQLTTPAFHSPPTHQFDRDIGSANADHAANITITLSATSGMGITITASAGLFIAGDVGCAIVSGAGLAYISALGGAGDVTSTDPNTNATLHTVVTANVTNAFAAAGPIAAGSWFLRGSPQGYANFGKINANIWGSTTKFGAGQQQDLYTFGSYPVHGQAPPGFTDSFRLMDVGNWLVVGGSVSHIDSLTSASHVVATLYSPISATTANPAATGPPLIMLAQSGGTWTLEQAAFSAANGYPRACGFFQDRLYLAGSLAQPQQIWASNVGDYENFAKGGQASSGLDFGINSGRLEFIQAVKGFQGLLFVHTLRTEQAVGGGVVNFGGQAQTLTPQNVTVVTQSEYGTDRIQPIVVDGDLLYVKRSKLASGAMSFDIQRSLYGTRNLSVLSELMTVAGFKEMVYQQFPYPVIWFTTLDGNAVGLTYERYNEVWGWHRYFTGMDLWPTPLWSKGAKPTRNAAGLPAEATPELDGAWTQAAPPATPDQVVSLCVIADPSIITDQLWLCTARQINGVATYMIELADPSMNVDCGSKYSGAPVDHINNMGYLNGRTVVANADGAVEPSQLMTAGGVYNLSVGKKGSKVQVGLPIIASALTVRPEAGGGAQSIQGLRKAWQRVFARVYQTLGLKVNNQPIIFRYQSDPMTAAPAQFTGDKKLEVAGDWDRDGRVLFTHEQPEPCTILASLGTLSVGED